MIGRVDTCRSHGLDSKSRVSSSHLGEEELRLTLDPCEYWRSAAGRSRGAHTRDVDETEGLVGGCEVDEGAGASQCVVARDLDILAEEMLASYQRERDSRLRRLLFRHLILGYAEGPDSAIGTVELAQ